MKKILFVIDTLQLGGAEQSLLANTVRFDHSESVICHLYEGEALKPEFVKNGKKVYSLNIKKKYGFLQAYKKLSEIVKNEKPDLIVAYLTRSELVARVVAKKQHIPVIGTFVNDLYTPSYNQHLSYKAKQLVKVFKFLNKVTSRYCIGFVANSQAIADANAKHLSIDDRKIKVIRRGRDSSRIRKKIAGEALEPVKFVNVSRLFTVKGHRTMIMGFNEFHKQYSNATLSIVGDGPLRTELETLVKELGLEQHVFFLGARKDVPELLANYDCFVFPSIMEGFSGAIVEAMFAGIPVLATDIPQNLEAVTHMETGYIFRTESAEEITKALSWFVNNRKQAAVFAERAYDYAKNNFELNHIVSLFEDYLHHKMESVK